MKLLSLLFLFSFSAHASKLPECMGSRDGSWVSLDLDVRMSRNKCPSVLELQEGVYLVRYELSGGPEESSSKITCHWNWVPGGGGGGLFEPAGEAPDTVVCSLRL